MTSQSLSSDGLNYLIWRYLQESGQGEAAAKLQQYWLRDPQELPFAPQIGRKALISLVQKGLKYHQIEHSKSNASNTTPAAFYFGSETTRIRTSTSPNDAFSHSGLAPGSAINGFNKAESESQNLLRVLASTSSKHTSHEIGTEPNGVSDAHTPAGNQQTGSHELPQQPTYQSEYGHAVDAMDIGEGPLPALEPQLISTLVEGYSKAIQSESVKDLGPSASPLTFAERQVIIHTAWNPDSERSILAVGGYGLCQLLHFTDGMATKEPTRIDLFQAQEISMVTSMAWNPDGTVLAVAARVGTVEHTGNVSTWTADGRSIDDLTAAQDLVLKLRWNTNSNMLLGITTTGEDASSLIAWDIPNVQAFPIQCGHVITDAIWTGDNLVTLCGVGALGRWDIWSNQGIQWAQKTNPELAEREWSHVFYEPGLETCHVFAEDSAYIASINSSGAVDNMRNIHSDSITQISGGYPRPVYVTSSLDGSVKVWEHELKPVSALQFGPDSPPLTAALNKQSSLLAAANQSKVLVWDSSGRQVPIGSLKVDLGRGSRVSLPNGSNADRDSGIGDDCTEDDSSEPGVSLDWDSTGRRLALAIANQMIVIDVDH